MDAEDTRRCRLLFLAYPFPPSPAIGAVRAWHMARHLARLGWQVTVVTPAPRNDIPRQAVEATAERCKQEGIRRVFAGRTLPTDGRPSTKKLGPWLRYLTNGVLRRVFRTLGVGVEEVWVLSCIRACRRFRPGEHDVVLATGSPFSTFIAANRVASMLRIQYVLDYRDPWSLSPFRRKISAWYIRRMEDSLVRRAAATLIVSPSLAENQARAFPMGRPPVVTTNGYDPEEFEAVKPMRFSDFAVVYTGSFYERRIEIDPVIKAIRTATKPMEHNGARIRLHYYGNGEKHVLEQAKKYCAEDVVVCHGHVPRSEALAAIKGAGAVAVIASIRERTDLAERGIVTGKVFEPLGMGVPILLIAPEGSDATGIVEGSGAGQSFRASQVEAIARWLVELVNDPGRGHYTPPLLYSWPVLAQRVHAILLSAISAREN